MLNAGLSTLDYLKSRILPEASREETTWDEALSKMGMAIARRMEGHCARLFDRAEDAEDEFSAWTLAVTLRRYPVETISSISLRAFTGAAEEVDLSYNLASSSGLIEFQSVPGCRDERLLITYTGGYWLDDGGTMPAGATPLPDDLLEIWISEIQATAEARGTFEAIGLRAQKDATKAPKINGLSEDAVDALKPYRRFSGE